MEIWKNYNQYIEVSSYGRIKCNRNLKKPYLDKDGYCIITIKNKHYKVHRLVAMLFIENKDNKKEVNHKDLNKTNNRVNNLEWCSHLENMQHAFKNKNIGASRNKKVIQYSLNGEKIKIWNSIKEATKELNISNGNISKCCNHKIGRTGLYKWEYLK